MPGFSRLAGLYLLALIATLALPSKVLAEPVIPSGCEVDYPPFCFVEENGEAHGFSVELMRAALGKMGREVTFRTGPWAEVRGWLERGEVDCLPLVGRTPEREALFDFTVPYLTMRGAIVVREETGDVNSLADLRGRRVGVMKGDNAEEFLRREDRGLDIVTAPTFADSFRDLAEGRCDAVVIQRLVALRLLEETGLKNLKIIQRPVAGFSQGFCFAVKEGDREMLSVLNEGLALAVADGTHRRLHAKWFAHLELPADRPIVVGGDHNYPPFEFLDEKGRPAGFTVELTRAIARELNLNVQIQLGPWEGIVEELKNGEIDAIQGMFYTAERDRVLDFSSQYLSSHYVGVTDAREGPPPETLEELAGRSVAVQAGDAILGPLAEQAPDARLVTVETQEDVLRAVAEGRAECGVAVRLSALYLLESNEWPGLRLGKQPLFTGGYCYAVPHGREALLAEFNEGLLVLRHTDQFRRIHEQWLGVYEPGISMRTVLKYIAVVAGPILLIAVLALLWSWGLRRQVAARTRELREQQTFFRAVLDNLPVGVAVNSVEPGVTFDYMNDLFPEIYRTTREALAEPDAFWQAVYGDDRFSHELRRRVLEDCASGDPARMVWSDVPIAREGEETTYISARNTPIPGTDIMISSVWDVTERKRAEEELAVQYRLLRVAGETARFGGWSIDLAANRCTWSDVVAEIHEMPPGYSPTVEEGIAFYASEWRDRITQVFTACAEEGTPYEEEMEILTSTGKRVWVRTTGEAVRNEQGDIVQVQGSFQDITERKRAEARIEHVNRVLLAVRNVNQLITHEKDREALLRQACDILIETRGYSSAWMALFDSEGDLRVIAEAGIGEAFGTIQKELESGDMPACCRRALAESEVVVMHNTQTNCVDCALSDNYPDTAALAGVLAHAGRDYGVLVVALPAELADNPDEQSLFQELAGDIGYALYGIESEEDRRRAEARLQESEAQYRALFETSADGILIADIGTTEFRYANPAACRFLGYAEGELLRMKLEDIHPPEDVPRILADFRRQARGELLLAVDVPCLTKDGEIAYADINAVSISVGGRDCVAGFFRDITARKKAEEEREQLEAQLIQLQKMETVGQLAGGVAHDFNNILTGIKGFVNFALDTVPADSETAADLREVSALADRAASLTRQLLAFSRRQTLQLETLDVNAVIKDEVKMLRRLIGEDIELAFCPGQDVGMVFADVGQLEQIIMNLAVNAQDAMPNGGKLTIETANVELDDDYAREHVSAVPGPHVMIAVSDTGCGMDEQTRLRIFDPFFTTKQRGQGTGLGLSTVYGIVKQHQGNIWVYSEPGQGTTFKIYLPLHEGKAETVQRKEPASPPTSRGETILLVEDEGSVLKLGERMLASLGYNALAARTVQEAMQLAEQHAGPIHLLITDVVMPEMNGRQLAEHMQQLYPEMKVLFVSGYTANVIAHQGILDKDVDFLQKPFSMSDLATRVRRALDADSQGQNPHQ